MPRKLVLYIAMSLDGFIAKDEDNIDFLSLVEAPPEDYGFADFLNNIDTMIWGRKTYDKVKNMGIESVYKGKKVYVASKSKSGKESFVEYVNDVKTLVEELKKEETGKDIYCDGGAEIVAELLRYGLIDRMTVSIIPHLVGQGVRLFKEGLPEQGIRLTKSLHFPSGLVQLWYEKK